MLESAEVQCPPLWLDYKENPPKSDIGHIFVYINGTRKGRIAQPMAGQVTRDMIVDQWPMLNVGNNQVKLDFRPASGPGTLGIITYDEGPATEQIYTGEYGPGEEDPTAEALKTLIGFSTRLMDQNERLQQMVLSSGQSAAESQLNSHERIFQHMALSMERDRERQDQWREREAARDDRELKHRKAAYEQDPTKDMMMQLLPQLLSGGGPMSEVQNFMMQKLTESMMDKVESMAEGASGGGGGVEAIIQQLAPMFTGGGAETPPDAS